jgi:hypothetical protein
VVSTRAKRGPPTILTAAQRFHSASRQPTCAQSSESHQYGLNEGRWLLYFKIIYATHSCM